MEQYFSTSRTTTKNVKNNICIKCQVYCVSRAKSKLYHSNGPKLYVEYKTKNSILNLVDEYFLN
jgi:hypothetical protein